MLAWEPDKLRGERTKRDKVIGKKKLTSGSQIGFFVFHFELHITNLLWICSIQ